MRGWQRCIGRVMELVIVPLLKGWPCTTATASITTTTATTTAGQSPGSTGEWRAFGVGNYHPAIHYEMAMTMMAAMTAEVMITGNNDDDGDCRQRDGYSDGR
ncbi:hypothetical protein E2C01_010033 [Portunus trituberculatus]|uniref:Secreted protein n=1 Tax=Portunus trituberculatus TaxID=210409 RepID=A0A5B7D7D8_PORTR|nr:hypothetical protein [Portunus trituberculatus]